MNTPFDFSRYRAVVVVSSTRAAQGVYEDKTGPLLVQWLRNRGMAVRDPLVVEDARIGEAIDDLLADAASRPDLLITTGGTGLTSDDRTVEAVRPYLERELPGITQAFFAKGLESVPTAVLSRAVAGTVGGCFVMTLPGSRGAVKDGIAILDPLLEHILSLVHNDKGSCQHVNPAAASSSFAFTASSASLASPDAAASASASVSATGQAAEVVDALVTTEPLEPLLAAAKKDVVTDYMGALVCFEGTIRDHDKGEAVAGLTFSSHPDAEKILRGIAETVAVQLPTAAPVRLWAAHRVGKLKVGELAFVVLAAAAHRKIAFTATNTLVDAVKAQLPIWKEQQLTDGSTQWLGIE